MNVKQLCIAFLFISLLSAQKTDAQDKFERESRITTKEVPALALGKVQNWNLTSKIKWYVEESNDGKTFEAKTCYNNNKYSIEFSEKGNLIDIEKTIKFSKLEKEIQRTIHKVLSNKFQKFRIKKVQIQYSSEDKNTYEAVFKLNRNEQSFPFKYEIILKGKKEDRYKNYEFLISSSGIIEKEFIIKTATFINLEF